MNTEVTLQLYAAVVAALGEGFPLSQVLEHEGLSQDAWEDGEATWVDRLQDSADTDLTLMDELERALADQRARFARPVTPLDDSFDDFLNFQRHLAAAQSPVSLLAQHGLFLGDWVRLQELWAERLVVEPALRERAAQILGRLDLPPLPSIQPGPHNFPPHLRTQVSNPVEVPKAMDEQLLEWGMGVMYGEAPPTHPSGAKNGSQSQAPVSEPPIVSSPVIDVARMSEYVAPPPHLPSQFTVVIDEVPPITHDPESIAPTPRNPLPFAPRQPSKELADPSLLVESERSVLLSSDELQTAERLVPNTSPLPANAPRELDIEEQRDPFAQTVVLVPDEQAPVAPLPLQKSAEPTQLSSDTDPNLRIPNRPVLPFQPADIMTTEKKAFHPLLPGQPPSSDRWSQVSLSLDQYACLCAEVTVFPEQAEAIFKRHGLSRVRDRLSLDRKWQERLGQNPVEYQEWQRLYQRWMVHWTKLARGSW